MATILLEIESRESLAPVQTETLHLLASALTVAELIAERVRSKAAGLSGADREKAVAAALTAFEHGAYLLIVDDRRRTDPEELLTITPLTRVRFWRLVPLVGG